MRAISSMFIPAAAKVCEKVDEANVRRQLLLQAIKVASGKAPAARQGNSPTVSVA